MNKNETVILKSAVIKVLEIAQACLDEHKKGWWVKISVFWDAPMHSL